jgi:hypothetical protein
VGFLQDLRRLAMQIGFVAHAGPYVDGTTGNAYARVDGTLSLGWTPLRDWRFNASGSGSAALNGPQRGQTTTVVQLGAGWSAARGVALSMGLTGQLQEAAPQGPGRSLRQVSVFLGFNGATGDRL